MTNNVIALGGLHQLTDRYDCILCDVWGVLHNGKTIWRDAANALTKAREAGIPVVMITNAPRPRSSVLRQLSGMNCAAGVFDDLITSGDVTRTLIQQLNGPVYHIGPERDYALYDGLEVEFTSPEQATGIVCTGLFDDYNEHPGEYVGRFKEFVSWKLPFVCANPDIVVEVVDKHLWCAGALAREYEKLGGETRIVGKPYGPIYEVALQYAENLTGRHINRNRVLAVGDGLPTDIKGAADNGLDALFITNGIHASEYTNTDVDEMKLYAFLAEQHASPDYWMKTLAW